MGNKIFISYRREDSADVTSRIYDHLLQPIGKFRQEDIFRDVDSIPFGIDFREHIETTMQNCEVVLVVIGPRWLSVTDSLGNLRLNDPHDFVRIEVDVALQRGIPVIPLLVMNARMPTPEDLPENIRDLAFRNGIEVRRDPNFKADMGRLNKSLDNWIEVPQTELASATTKSKGHILITYNPKNDAAAEIARTLNSRLKDEHYITWIDYEQPRDWKTGSWNDSIERVIFDSAALLTIYSDEQATSKYFKHELKIAKNIRVPVIAVLPPYQKLPDSIESQVLAVVSARTNNKWYENLIKLFERFDRPPTQDAG